MLNDLNMLNKPLRVVENYDENNHRDYIYHGDYYGNKINREVYIMNSNSKNKVAKIYYATERGNGSEYDHPQIWVYDEYDHSIPENHNSPVYRLEFQRHLIEGREPELNQPARKYNPGGYWSESYGCSFDDRHARIDLLEKQLSFVKKLDRAIKTYNLGYVAGGDELYLIVLALEKLRYDIQSNPS